MRDAQWWFALAYTGLGYEDCTRLPDDGISGLHHSDSDSEPDSYRAPEREYYKPHSEGDRRETSSEQRTSVWTLVLNECVYLHAQRRRPVTKLAFYCMTQRDCLPYRAYTLCGAYDDLIASWCVTGDSLAVRALLHEAARVFCAPNSEASVADDHTERVRRQRRIQSPTTRGRAGPHEVTQPAPS